MFQTRQILRQDLAGRKLKSSTCLLSGRERESKNILDFPHFLKNYRFFTLRPMEAENTCRKMGIFYYH